MNAPVPTTVISGALGVGKTTAILALLAGRPEGQRWAVLVNEFGQVGLDGALISDAGDGLEVREIAGGCICCTAGLPLKVGLTRLLREVRPDRLLIEPTGLAHPASIIDTLRSPGLREAVDLRATITIVDPRRFVARLSDPLYADQVRAADVLVAGFADLVSDEVLERFRAAAATLYPPPLVVATAAHGALDPAWLELRASPRARASILPPAPEVPERGFVWPPEVVFDPIALEEALQDLVRPGPVFPAGVLRAKGVFRTPRGWRLLQATPDQMSFEPVAWRRDSRVEWIAAGGPVDWDAVEARLEAAVKVSATAPPGAGPRTG